MKPWLTGIVPSCLTDIYGPGRGPGRTNSIYFPVYLQEIEKTGSPFYAGEGTNTRSWVHIEDLMIVYLKLVEAAAAGGGNATWGKEVPILDVRWKQDEKLLTNI